MSSPIRVQTRWFQPTDDPGFIGMRCRMSVLVEQEKLFECVTDSEANAAVLTAAFLQSRRREP